MTERQHHNKTNLKGGDYLIRESSSRDTTDFGFARSVSYKVCWNPKTEEYGICSINDGMCLMFKDKQELCNHLNGDQYGYRQLKKSEYYSMLSGTMQGFDPKFPSI